MRILMIEDDAVITRVLARGLKAHGYEIAIAGTGEEGLLLAEDATVELVLLDILLPGIDGHEVLKRIREHRVCLPVIMLTARDDLKNKVSALHGGADDYLTKPFAFEELLARIRAVIRRAAQPASSVLRVGPLRLDLLARRLWRGDKLIDLSQREFELLEYLMRHPNQTLSRQQILADVWKYSQNIETNIVEVYIGYLRNKIDEGNTSLIGTVQGAGYHFKSPK